MALAFSPRKSDQIVLGRPGKYWEARHKISMPFTISDEHRRKHMYIVGTTGSGKSSLLMNLILQDIEQGHGVLLIDPNADLALTTIKHLNDKGFFHKENGEYDEAKLERFIYFGLSDDPDEGDYLPSFNVLAKSKQSTPASLIADRIVTAFERTWDEVLSQAPNFDDVLSHAIMALVETGGTLIDVYKLLLRDDYRKAKIDQIKDQKTYNDCFEFFNWRYAKWGSRKLEKIESALNKVSKFKRDHGAFYLLAQKNCSLNIDEMLDKNKIVFVNLGAAGKTAKKLIPALIFSWFEQSVLARAKSYEEERKDFSAYIDEFQVYASRKGDSQTFDTLGSQGRKFKIRLTAANQYFHRIYPDLRGTLEQFGTFGALQITATDAPLLAKILKKKDVMAILRDPNTDIQHPQPMSVQAQAEMHEQELQDLKPQMLAVKTSDARRSMIWTPYMRKPESSNEQLEELLRVLGKKHGQRFSKIKMEVLNSPHSVKEVSTDYSR